MMENAEKLLLFGRKRRYASLMSASEGENPSCSNGGISRKCLESVTKMIDAFRYTGNRSIRPCQSCSESEIGATSTSANVSSAFVVKQASCNGSLASNGNLEETENRSTLRRSPYFLNIPERTSLCARTSSTILNRRKRNATSENRSTVATARSIRLCQSCSESEIAATSASANFSSAFAVKHASCNGSMASNGNLEETENRSTLPRSPYFLNIPERTSLCAPTSSKILYRRKRNATSENSSTVVTARSIRQCQSCSESAIAATSASANFSSAFVVKHASCNGSMASNGNLEETENRSTLRRSPYFLNIPERTSLCAPTSSTILNRRKRNATSENSGTVVTARSIRQCQSCSESAIATTSGSATLSPAFAVKQASCNGSMASNGNLEETENRSRPRRSPYFLNITERTSLCATTSSTILNRRKRNTTSENSSTGVTANEVFVNGQSDEVLPASASKKMKRLQKVAAQRDSSPVLTHDMASQRTKKQRKKTSIPATDEVEQACNPVKCKRRATMKKAEKLKDCYRRVGPDNNWDPPDSPYELLQELYAFDPWRVIVICMLLNQTTGAQVKKVIKRVFLTCPTAEAAIQVPSNILRDIIEPLGLQNKRVRDIQDMSRQYLQEGWTHVTQLHGVGKYAADAYAIFCAGKPEDIIPDDHMLVKYWEYVIKWKREHNFLQID